MRVLIVADAYPSASWPDANPFLHVQASGLVDAGHHVSVLCPTPFVPGALRGSRSFGRFAGLRRRDRHDGIEVRRPRFPRPPGAWFRRFAGPVLGRSCWPAFRAAVTDARPDVVHAHMATPVGYAAIGWSRRAGIPSVLTVHGLDITEYPARHRALMRQTVWALENAGAVVAVSRDLADRTVRLAATPVRVGYIGVDTKTFRFDADVRARTRATLGLSPTAIVLCFVGRLVREKGARRLMEILRSSAAAHDDVSLIIVGDGPEAPAMRVEAQEATAGNRVIFVGGVAHDEVRAFLCASDILIQPTDSEGFGMALIEAQACRVPVVASRTGGVVEAVRETVTALLCEPDDIECFVGATRRLIMSADERGRLGRAGRDHVMERFTIERCSADLVEVYRSVVDE